MNGQGGTPEEWDHQADRRNGGGRRLEDQLRDHRADAFAHPALVDRLLTASGLIRADVEKRLRMLEVFAGRVILIGVVFGILLGATAGVVLAKLLR